MSPKIRATILSALLGMMLISQTACGQNPIPAASRPVYVIIDARVRAPLVASWNDTSLNQVERGFCIYARAGAIIIGKDKSMRKVGLIVALDSLVKPDSVEHATPISINFFCPKDAIPLHTHVPTTCMRTPDERNDKDIGPCMVGGDEAWECFASQSDWDSLIEQGREAGAIQCDKHAVIVYVNPQFMEDMLR